MTIHQNSSDLIYKTSIWITNKFLYFRELMRSFENLYVMNYEIIYHYDIKGTLTQIILRGQAWKFNMIHLFNFCN